MRKVGLALEGGGSRGAYHMGVAKAYLESGYQFDGFVGTSIGAINAAILAQGDFQQALTLWENITMEHLFHEVKLTKNVQKIMTDGGIDTSKIRAFVDKYIDEDKIRQSGKDFGLVTVSLDERKPYEVFLEDIPYGKLTSYLMASATLPGFQLEKINEKKFIDGGVYNNCPINLLIEKGYDEIIAVRTDAPGIFRKFKESANIKIISASASLGNWLMFSPAQSKANIKLGYYDGLRTIHNLAGQRYYLKGTQQEASLLALNDDVILKVGMLLGISELPAKRMLFEEIIPKLGKYLELKKDFNYSDFMMALLEYSADQKGIERFVVYDLGEFCSLIKKTPLPKREKSMLNLINIALQNKKTLAIEAIIDALD